MQAITFNVAEGRTGDWFTLLRGGFAVRPGHSNLPPALEEALGVDRRFLETEVRTIFINGRPVDDMDAARVADGDVVALAGAMPGLVGACMRRDSPLSGFRNSITYHAESETNVKTGAILVKLFNTVAEAVGRRMLGQGIEVKAPVLAGFLENRTLSPLAGVESIEMDGRALDPEQAARRLAETPGYVILRVIESASA